MKNLYIAHRLLKEYGLTKVVIESQYEEMFACLMTDSELMLQREIVIPIISNEHDMLVFYLRQWEEIKLVTSNQYSQRLALFTLTRHLLKRYKSNKSYAMMSLMSTLLARCLDEQPEKTCPNLLFGSLIIGYGVWLLFFKKDS